MFEDEPAPAAAAEPEEEDGPKDLADLFARAAIEEWLQGMHRFAARPDIPDLFRIDRDSMATLVGQLAAGARRLGLRDAIAGRMRAAAAYNESLANRLLTPVMIAERAINDYVTGLGFQAMPADGYTAMFAAMLLALPFMADFLQSHMMRISARIVSGG